MTKRIAIGAFSVLLLALVLPLVQHNAVGGTEAPAEVDEGLFEQGEQLYEAECAVCHQADGAGDPPVFPALRDNEQLEDLELIVGNIHLGEGAMPAFPGLDADEIAGLATYIRNAWGNEFGGVTEEAVAVLLDQIAEPVAEKTVWDAVFTGEQAERGGRIYVGVCADCHGRRGDGAGAGDMPPSPAVAGPAFLRGWSGRNVATLYEFTRATMPLTNPGSLDEQEYIDVIAYMLQLTGLPAGDEELPADPGVLAGIFIEQQADGH